MTDCNFQLIFSKNDVLCRTVSKGCVQDIDKIRFDAENLALRMRLFAKRINSVRTHMTTELILPPELTLVVPTTAPAGELNERPDVHEDTFKNIPIEELYINSFNIDNITYNIAVERYAVDEAINFSRAHGIEPNTVSAALSNSGDFQSAVHILNIGAVERITADVHRNKTDKDIPVADFPEIPSALRGELLKRQLYARKKTNNSQTTQKPKNYLNRQEPANPNASTSNGVQLRSKPFGSAVHSIQETIKSQKWLIASGAQRVREITFTQAAFTAKRVITYVIKIKIYTIKTRNRLKTFGRNVLCSILDTSIHAHLTAKQEISKIFGNFKTKSTKIYKYSTASTKSAAKHAKLTLRRASAVLHSSQRHAVCAFNRFISLIEISINKISSTLRASIWDSVKILKRTYSKLALTLNTIHGKIFLFGYNNAVIIKRAYTGNYLPQRRISARKIVISGVAIGSVAMVSLVSASFLTSKQSQQNLVISDGAEPFDSLQMRKPQVLMNFPVIQMPTVTAESFRINEFEEFNLYAPVITAAFQFSPLSAGRDKPMYDDTLPITLVSPAAVLSDEYVASDILPHIDDHEKYPLSSGDDIEMHRDEGFAENSSLVARISNEPDALDVIINSGTAIDMSSLITSEGATSEYFSSLSEGTIDTNSESEDLENLPIANTQIVSSNEPNDIESDLPSVMPTIRPRQRPRVLTTEVNAMAETQSEDRIETRPTSSLASGITETIPPAGFRVLAIVGADPQRQALVELGKGQTGIVSSGSVTPFGRIIQVERNGLILQTETSQVLVKIGH